MKQEIIFDVVVVGAGPCGATAAYYLAHPEHGHSAKQVALLDKATFPRDKYCGDAWCAPALDILEDMQVLQKLEAQGLIQDCTSGGFVSPSGESFISTGEEAEDDYSLGDDVRCYAIKRMICDEAIVRRAEEVGAQLFENADVESASLEAGVWRVVCRDGREFLTKILIAADGAASNLSRTLGIVTTAPDAMASRQYIKGGTHNFKSGGVLFYPDYAIPGYVAIFRHYNDDIDVGVYLLANGATKPEDILQVSIDAVAKDPFMQRVIGKSAVPLERPRVASIRTGGVEKSYSTQFLAVGDAAGQTDPLTGEGIHTGMIGARIAAQCVHEMFAQNDFSEKACSEYHKRWMKNFGKDFPASAIGGRLTYKIPLFLDAANVVAQRKGDAFMADFGAAMTGVKPKSTFLRPGVAIPITLEIFRQFFIQKILRPYQSMRHAYDMRAITPDDRATAFHNACIKDNNVPAGLIDLNSEGSAQSYLDQFTRLQSTDANARTVLVIYASEYGYAEESAKRFSDMLFQQAKQQGTQALNVPVLNAKHIESLDWSCIDNAVFLCSTAGDGDPPQSAKALFALLQDKQFSLAHLAFSVLALGDSAYPNYCAAGIKLRTLLLDNQAQEWTPLIKVNAENTQTLNSWQQQLVCDLTDKSFWKNPIDPNQYSNLLESVEEFFSQLSDEVPKANAKHPFNAYMQHRTLIGDAASGGKETFHVTLDISQMQASGFTLHWKPGDALGVLPDNPLSEVNALLKHLNKSPDESVVINGETHSFIEALSSKKDIKNISSQLKQLLACDFDAELELQDVVQLYPEVFAQMSAQAIVDSLSTLAPRYYSIASDFSDDTLDLCVATQYLSVNKQQRLGVASNYLNKQLDLAEQLKVFVHANEDFRTPSAESEAACVMIGAGTGIAPYRAFMQALENQTSARPHLLFFGCRHEQADFLYKEEMQQWQAKGLLKIFTAFSRDQAEKLYVQHRLKEQAELIWQRLQAGDHVYVCGDATQMAGDVEKVLLEIIMQEGLMSAQQAEDFLKELAKQKRYQKDVWV